MAQLVEIENELFPQPWSEFHFSEEINTIPVAQNWVISENDNLIGYVFGWFIENEYHLNNIAVKKQFQGQGIGDKLLSEVIQFVNSNNGKLIFLEVLHENEAAIRLYEKHGFHAVGKRKDYYTKGKHAILYTLELNNG